MTTPAPLTCYATATPGLEAVLVEELAALGHRAVPDAGGAEFSATSPVLADALLRLRTASRLVVRMAQFRARTFAELERHGGKVDWGSVVPAGMPVHFRVTSKKSRLYHQDGIAERLERCVAAAVGDSPAVRAPADAESREDDVTRLPEVQRFVVRVFRDEVSISADASGALLHRRGWRQDVARAPLRETLAAAMLAAIGGTGDVPLHAPFMGSGTIPIEAALLARRMVPGRGRRFAAEQWPGLDAAFLAARTRAGAGELPRAAVPIGGSDRDPGGTMAAIANAERAGVVLDVAFSRATVSALPPDDGPGLLITNPPYGVRVGELTALRSLYAALGNVLRDQRPNWQLAMLVNDRVLQGQVGVPLREVFRTTNGGLAVRMVATR